MSTSAPETHVEATPTATTPSGHTDAHARLVTTSPETDATVGTISSSHRRPCRDSSVKNIDLTL